MNALEIVPVEGPLDARIRPPGSKSITNRALICAAAANGVSHLEGVLTSEDTEVMIEALRALGLSVHAGEEADQLSVEGAGGRFRGPAEAIYVANSGTTIRFLTAMLAAAGGEYRLDGVPRMRERPIEDLLDALRQLGAEARAENNGCPPVEISSNGLRGGSVSVRGDISSQYLSGLLMAAPLAAEDVLLEVGGKLVSRPYVDMTLQVMRAFGVESQVEGADRFSIQAPQAYQATNYQIEPDASAASYFWGAAAIVGGQVTVEGLSRDAMQGDVGFCDCLAQMGCDVQYDADSITVRRQGPLSGVDVDMNSISDTVQTLAAVALYCQGPTTIRGVAHNRHKETDRIGDLARELRKLGAEVEERPDGLVISPGSRRPAEVDTYNDHRMAMSLALVGLRTPGVWIRDPGCTVKTYPHYFEDFRKLTQ